MLKYKINILDTFKERGLKVNDYRKNKNPNVKKSQALSDSTLQKLRNNDTTLSADTINALCSILKCQPGDLLEYVEDGE